MSGLSERVRRWLLGVTAAAALAVMGAGCAEIEATEDEQYQPASLSPADEDGTKTVALTAPAAERVGLRTAAVKTRGPHREVPYEALIYDGQGRTWVYTEVDRLTFKRAPVAVLAVEDAAVLLSSGPTVGTKVVTQGSTQVYGAELGMAGKH